MQQFYQPVEILILELAEFSGSQNEMIGWRTLFDLLRSRQPVDAHGIKVSQELQFMCRDIAPSGLNLGDRRTMQPKFLRNLRLR
jgi:hypothetical protein